MSARVWVIGNGILADLVSEQLSQEPCELIRQSALPTDVTGLPGIQDVTECVTDAAEGATKVRVDLALVLDDVWVPATHQTAEAVFAALANPIPWLRGFVSFGQAVVGPLVRSGQPGCSQCADMRRLMAASNRSEQWELQQRWANQAEKSPAQDAWASFPGLLHVAQLVVAETQRVLQGLPARTEGHLYLVDLKTLATSRHFFLPDPTCPNCGYLPFDSPQAASLCLDSTPKSNVDSYHCRSEADLQKTLAPHFLDTRTGLLNGKAYDLVSPFAAASVNLPLPNGDEATAGRTHSYAQSELTAILEGLERHCGIEPRGKRTVIHDSFRNLGQDALNPLSVGVHAQEQYQQPSFPFRAFQEEAGLDWVWGYSLVQERPLLVPELLAYYSLGCDAGFVYETSNGCAVGGSLVEAIFHGILEVVERDAFLLTWYAQLPLRRLDIDSAADVELSLMAQRLHTVAGYDLHLFNATMENGIPSVWAIAKNRRTTGVNLICAAGAHVDPVRAAKAAVHELAGMVLTLTGKFEANREEFERMLDDPFAVRQMEDHSMLYSLPQAEERLQFLLQAPQPGRGFREQFPAWPQHADLTDDLKALLTRFRSLGLDVIVVDQTAPELRDHGLYCVKVLIPGMLPMTFGYHQTRLEGLDRVLHVPMQLGYAAHALTLGELNPHPHPFP